MIDRLKALTGSRLLGAWVYSLAARAISLVPIALFAVATDAAASESSRFYIAAFALIASLSYVLNAINESQRFAKSGAATSPHSFAIQTIGCVVAGGFLLSPFLDAVAAIDLFIFGAIAIQPLIAHARTAVVDSEGYRSAYASTGVRDIPAAVVAVIAMFIPTVAQLLPLALAVGCFVQWLALNLVGARHESAGSIDLDLKQRSASNVILVGIAAIVLAAFQPVARVLVELGGTEISLAVYELADRPAYMVVLAIAGGVGTELQRRWRDSSVQAAMRELRRSDRLVLLAMACTLLASLAMAFVASAHLEILRLGNVMVLLPISFAANAAYLLCVLRSRLLLANNQARQVVVSFSVGLLAVCAICLGTLALRGWYSPILVGASVLAGFLSALTILQIQIRTFGKQGSRP